MTRKKTQPQILRDSEGAPAFAVLPHAEYERLMRLAEDAEDLRAARAALEEDFRADLIPATIVHRIAAGENPVRVWREDRGLKAVALARSAGISPAYLSEIETGKKDGTFRTMTAIAACLGVPLDDLAPVLSDEERLAREYTQRINRVRAQIRLIEQLVTGRTDFSTGAVRRAAEALAADAEVLLQEDASLESWLRAVIQGTDQIRRLVDQAEGDIIETAESARRTLEDVVALETFRAPPKAEEFAAALPPRVSAAE